MMITLTPIGVATVLFHIVIVLAIVQLARITWRLDQFRKGLIAHARRAPGVPEARLIEVWKKLYDTLPKDSPKWMAYKNRLIEVVILDKDGQPIPIQVTASESDGD